MNYIERIEKLRRDFVERTNRRPTFIMFPTGNVRDLAVEFVETKRTVSIIEGDIERQIQDAEDQINGHETFIYAMEVIPWRNDLMVGDSTDFTFEPDVCSKCGRPR